MRGDAPGGNLWLRGRWTSEPVGESEKGLWLEPDCLGSRGRGAASRGRGNRSGGHGRRRTYGRRRGESRGRGRRGPARASGRNEASTNSSCMPSSMLRHVQDVALKPCHRRPRVRSSCHLHYKAATRAFQPSATATITPAAAAALEPASTSGAFIRLTRI